MDSSGDRPEVLIDDFDASFAATAAVGVDLNSYRWKGMLTNVQIQILVLEYKAIECARTSSFLFVPAWLTG